MHPACATAFKFMQHSLLMRARSLFPRQKVNRVPAQVAVWFNRQLAHWFPNTWLFYSALLWLLPSERASAREMLDLLRRRRERKLSVRTSLWSCLLLAEKVHTLWGDRAKWKSILINPIFISAPRAGTPPKFRYNSHEQREKILNLSRDRDYTWTRFSPLLCSMSGGGCELFLCFAHCADLKVVTSDLVSRGSLGCGTISS